MMWASSWLQAWRRRVVRACWKMDDAAWSGLTVKVADSVDELDGSACLLHDAYVARGILAPHPSGRRVTRHYLSQSTTTFVAKQGSIVIGTLSLFRDGSLGLPMESVFAEEVQRQRGGRRALAEVGALAIDPRMRRRGVSLLLNKMMYRSAREHLGVKDLLIAVHPRAHTFYKRVLQFHRVGSERQYPGLNEEGQAIAMHLDLERASDTYRTLYGETKTMDNPHHLFLGDWQPCMIAPPHDVADVSSRVRVLARPFLERACDDLLEIRPIRPETRLPFRTALPSYA